MTAFLYIIGNKHLPTTVKVGITNNLIRRCKELQTGSSEPLSVLHKWATGTMKNARDIEREAHIRLRSFRTSGEWFDVDDIKAKAIVESIINKEIIQQEASDIKLKKLNQAKVELEILSNTNKELSNKMTALKKECDEVSLEWHKNLLLYQDMKDKIKLLE